MTIIIERECFKFLTNTSRTLALMNIVRTVKKTLLTLKYQIKTL